MLRTFVGVLVTFVDIANVYRCVTNIYVSVKNVFGYVTNGYMSVTNVCMYVIDVYGYFTNVCVYKELQQQSYWNKRGCPCGYTILLLCLDVRYKRTAKWKAPPHPSLPSPEVDRKRKQHHVVW